MMSGTLSRPHNQRAAVLVLSILTQCGWLRSVELGVAYVLWLALQRTSCKLVFHSVRVIVVQCGELQLLSIVSVCLECSFLL